MHIILLAHTSMHRLLYIFSKIHTNRLHNASYVYNINILLLLQSIKCPRALTLLLDSANLLYDWTDNLHSILSYVAIAS